MLMDKIHGLSGRSRTEKRYLLRGQAEEYHLADIKKSSYYSPRESI
jgi:hypothetical protein